MAMSKPQTLAHHMWGVVLSASLWLLLVVSSWYYLQLITRLGGWFHGFGVIVIYALLALVLERFFRAFPIKQSWRYRCAFLLSLGLFLLQWLALSLLRPSLMSASYILPVWFGAFIGGLAASTLENGLWENNYPPSRQVRDDVRQSHLKIIGQPRKAPATKRLFDICLALVGFLLSSPVWILSGFMIWFEDPGPLLFIKNSVGVGGVNFHQWKFRTMERAAERNTGPVMASEGDERVLWVGRILRKSALDELPQLVNILVGEMSFVGPRPQRTVLVRQYLQDIPEYAYRHRVLPGLAGLAQVAGDYYLTPRQKLRYDRLYIKYISLSFDLKLVVLAFLLAFWFRWRNDWDGRLPRGLLRFGYKKRSHGS